MEKVYKNTDEITDKVKVVPVFDRNGLGLDVYLDGRKVGRIDKHNKEISTKVKVAEEEKAGLPVYRGEKPFSISDAFYHYFGGSGTPVFVDSAEVDIGLKPADFTGEDGYPAYQDLVKSMYRKNGTLDVDTRKKGYVGGWAGNVTYRLKGSIKSTTYEWRFSGYIKPFDDKFNFDSREWGERKKWAEIVTRMIGALPAGKVYDIRFKGRREVTDGGRW
ncbi:MAG: lipid II-degrading bacteriocin [Desulfobacterales bacterium]|nr:lipid II-degrading bacteriocin [Desulfobacterales bacterium]